MTSGLGARPSPLRPGAASRRPSTSGGVVELVCGRLTLRAPARIMAPRVLVVALALGLTLFGLVMIFSASSVKAVSATGDAWAYVLRQARFAGIGLVAAAFIVAVDYHHWCRAVLPLTWLVTIVLLVFVELFGTETNGATRWVMIGSFSLQPSEFAKVTILMAAVNIANDFLGERSVDLVGMLLRLGLFVAAPLVLILVQPDKGTTGIVIVMLLAVAVSAGFPGSVAAKVVIAGIALALVVTLSDSYSRARLFTMLDPWADQYDDGWQLTQGFIAFGSGGLFGRGVGMSVQKYSWLPESHNDFIFAIVGEELGLVGALCLLAAFALLFREMLKVAHDAPDLEGRLLATGATALLCSQLFLNVAGVLGMFPLSGKPLPFISYGGSSIISCLMVVACVVNVSLRSSLPETVHDVRRRQMTLADEDTGVGEAHVRSASAGLGRASSVPIGAAAGSARGLRVVEGGSGREAVGGGVADGGVAGGFDGRCAGGGGIAGGGQRAGGGGRGRIDLGPSASERLRSGTGPRVRGRAGSRSADGDGSGAGRQGRPRRGERS